MIDPYHVSRWYIFSRRIKYIQASLFNDKITFWFDSRLPIFIPLRVIHRFDSLLLIEIDFQNLWTIVFIARTLSIAQRLYLTIARKICTNNFIYILQRYTLLRIVISTRLNLFTALWKSPLTDEETSIKILEMFLECDYAERRTRNLAGRHY